MQFGVRIHPVEQRRPVKPERGVGGIEPGIAQRQVEACGNIRERCADSGECHDLGGSTKRACQPRIGPMRLIEPIAGKGEGGGATGHRNDRPMSWKFDASGAISMVTARATIIAQMMPSSRRIPAACPIMSASLRALG